MLNSDQNNNSISKNLYPAYLAIIPARGGSKRIKRKNLTLLAGKPLISYSIKAALSANKLSKIIVSTDDLEIAEYAETLGVEVPFLRPVELAQDKSPVIEVILHTLHNIDKNATAIDAVVLLQPTSPLRTEQDINNSITLFEDTNADTLTAVCYSSEHPYYSWTPDGERIIPFFSKKKMITARQDLPVSLVENGSIYIIKRSVLSAGNLYGNKVVPYIMDKECSIDVDTSYELQWAEFILKKRIRE